MEPGLFEWLAWYQDAMPDFMSDKELAEAGYNIELSYKVKNFVNLEFRVTIIREKILRTLCRKIVI